MATAIAILTLIPLILGTIEKWVLIAESEGVSGSDKKAIVVDAVKETLGMVVMIPGVGKVIPIQLLEPMIGLMIDSVVRVMNLVGKLPKLKIQGESRE